MRRELRFSGSGQIIPVVLWLLFSTACILLASNQYTAVDGALRCLNVYWHRPPYLGPNNHLLYLANVWLWWHLATALGFRASGPFAFLRTVAAMNALSGGGAVALVSALVWRFTRNWKISLMAALVYAMSWTLLLHSTSSAEPPPGLFVSLAAVFATVEGLAHDRLVLVFIGGIGLALALANYESMFLVAPLVFLLCFVWTGKRTAGLTGSARPLIRLLISVLGSVAGVAGIYVAAYHRLGIARPGQMFRTFFHVGGEPEVYAGFGFSKLINFPAGLVNNVIAVFPSGYQGLRWMLQRNNVLWAAALAAVGVVVGGVLFLVAFAVRPLYQTRRGKVLCSLCVACLMIDCLPQLYWDPMYDKLWLQPLALIVLLGGILAGTLDNASASRLGAMVLLIILLEAGFNLPRVVFAHTEKTRCLSDAARIAELIEPHDKVVTDFDPVSSLWMGLYDGNPQRTLLFPATPASSSLATLDRWTLECAGSSCRIFFVALLDQPREVWDEFLTKRLKVPYNELEQYRQTSQSVDRFACENAGLRSYKPAVNSTS
jgi:hypothetical protein